MHTLLVSIGAAANSTAGYTMITLGEFFISHLHLSSKLADQKQQMEWIQRCSDTFALTLLRIGQHMRAIVDSRTPGDETLNTFILPFNHEVLVELKSAEKPLDEYLEKQAMEMRLTGSSSSAKGASTVSLVLPLLSEHGGTSSTNPNKKKSPDGELEKKKKPKPTSPSKVVLGVDGGLPHGCMARSWRYVNSNKNLITSGKSFDIPAIARHLGLKVSGPCWPFVLSLCADKNRMSRCNKLSDSRHAGNESEAHILRLTAGKSFDRDEIVANFSKPATEQQKQGLEAAPTFSARGRGKGRGRGREDGGRGRGRGGNDADTEEDDDDSSFQQPPEP